MAAADTGTSLTSYSIDLIDEYDTGSILLGLVEEVTHTRCADSDEHLYEIRTGNGEERHSRLSCSGSGNVCLTCSRRAHQKYALRDPGSQFVILAGILEEVYDLLKFSLLLFKSCNIIEGRLLSLDLTGAGLGELEGFAVPSSVHHDVEEEDHSSYHQHVGYDVEPE